MKTHLMWVTMVAAGIARPCLLLNQQCGPRSADPGAVYHLAFSLDGKLLASDGVVTVEGTGIKLWDVATGKLKVTLHEPQVTFGQMAFSPDGKTLIAGHSGHLDFTVWNLTTRKSKLIPTGNDIAGVRAVAFARDGKVFATGSVEINTKTKKRRGEIKLWDAATAKEKTTLKIGESDVRGLAFSPDGNLLAVASGFNLVRVWDIKAAKEKTPYKGSEYLGNVSAVAFSPNGKILAAGGTGSQLVMLDPITGKKISACSGVDDVDALAFSPDGKIIAAPGRESTVLFIDVSTGKIKATLKGHTKSVAAVAFSPDGKTFASAGHDGTIRLWDVPGK